MTTATKHQSNPRGQGSCLFGGQHTYTMPIYRDGQQVSPSPRTEDEDDWAECDRCGRIEDGRGRPVLDPPFPRAVHR